MANGKHRKPKDSSSTARAIAALVGASVASPLALMGEASAAPVSAWDRIAECESNGRWDLPYGDNGRSSGGLQFQPASWSDALEQLRADGIDTSAFPQGSGHQAYKATKNQQILAGEALLKLQGPGAWTCNVIAGGPLNGYSGGDYAPYLGGGAPSTPVPPKPAQPPAEEPADAEDGVYVVKAGDTLSCIAEKLGTDGGWQRLYEINAEVVGDDPDLIEPGMKLRLPGHEAPSKAGPVTVQGGDTLYGITFKLTGDGSLDNWKPLYEENRAVIGNDPDLIFPGQSLNVPDSWSGKHDKPAGDAHSHRPNDGSEAPSAKPSGAYVLPVQGRVGDGLIVAGACVSRTCGGHSGLDISAPSGTPVRAATAGTVASVNSSGAAYGQHVVVKHADGVFTLYAHLSAITVSYGQIVGAGQQIGNVGSTGASSGPHLHFEVRTDPTAFSVGTFLNPIAWLRSHGVTV